MSAQAPSDPIWSIGAQRLTFPASGGAIAQAPLPTSFTALNDAYEYQGALPQHNQNVQFDINGDVAFMIVDGSIYNAQGLLIADADLDPNCLNCMWHAAPRIAVLPVPAACGIYYIVSEYSSTDRIPQGFGGLMIGVLDLNLPNDFPYYAGAGASVMGRYANVGDDAYADYILPALLPMDLVDVANSSNNGPYLWEYTIPYSLGDPAHNITRIDAVEVASDGRSLMVAETEVNLEFLMFTANGPKSIAQFNKWNYGIFNDGLRSKRGEVEMTVNGNSASVAFSRKTGDDYGPYEHWLEVVQWSFTATGLGGATPTIASVGGPNNPRVYEVDHYTGLPGTEPLDYAGSPVTVPRVCGLEFSPSGQYLYFIKSSYSAQADHNLGYINTLLLPGVPGAVNEFDIGTNVNSRKMADSELETNVGPNGTGTALYAIGADPGPVYRLTCITDPDNPNPLNWNPNVLGAPLANIGVRSSIGPVESRMLNARLAQSTHLDYLRTEAECCVDLFNLGAVPGYTVPNTFGATLNWTPTSNPFGNSAVVYMAGDLVFEDDAKVHITGMTFYFDPDARVVVKRGGYVRFMNSTLTSWACEPRRWPGIRIEGSPGMLQNPAVGGDQGCVYLYNSTVENAMVGGWCTREVGGSSVGGYTGGILRSSGSTFRNCVRGVSIENYTFQPFQYCAFINTTFVTDANWPDPLVNEPYIHAYIAQTRGVNFISCRFANDSQGLFSTDNGGFGLVSIFALVRVHGNTNPASTYFRNLQAGMINYAGIVTGTVVDRMHFGNNVYGLYDMNSRFARYTNNTFIVPDVYQPGLTPRAGMFLWQSQLYTIERNAYVGEDGTVLPTDFNTGIYFQGYAPNQLPSVYLDNRIYDNDFSDLIWGNLIRHIHRGGGGTASTERGLQPLCGDYTNNLVDIAMQDETPIRPNQGESDPALQQSGNRFMDPADCASTFDWWLDPAWNVINNWPPNMSTDVYRNEDPLCDVLCDTWNGFDDNEVNGSGLWTETECGKGVLDNTHSLGHYLQVHGGAKALLDAALNAYNGNLDALGTEELLDMLEEVPALGSSTLRDVLLGSSPLTDGVLLAMLDREPALDPWHITQVLVANVRLNTGVLELSRETLTPFFFATVENAQNSSSNSWKQVMEEEISLRRLEKTNAFAMLGHLLASDTTIVGGPDTLRALIEADQDPAFTQIRTEHYILTGQWSAAADELAGPGSRLNGEQLYTTMLALGEAHNGDWNALTTSERATLHECMLSGYSGAAFAASLLWSIGATDYLPPVVLPQEYRAPDTPFVASTSSATTQPSLAVYPNPATDEAYVTLPPGSQGDVLDILDAQGRVVLSHRITELGVCRIELDGLPAGFYKAHLRVASVSTSLTIQR